MAKKQFLEAGRIVNTHGVRGEVKAEAWTDEPAVLAGLKTLYLEGRPLRTESARVHKGFVLLKLEGIDTVEAAMALKGKILTADRDSIPLAEGAFFLPGRHRAAGDGGGRDRAGRAGGHPGLSRRAHFCGQGQDRAPDPGAGRLHPLLRSGEREARRPADRGYVTW